MGKLLLTSSGFSQIIIREFLKLANKMPKEIKLLFIPTASEAVSETQVGGRYIEEEKEGLYDLGIEKQNVIIFNLDSNIEENKLRDIDVIYVCGGNTFYLLSKIRESGFDKRIKEMVGRGVIYVGVSAGSVLAGPNIRIAGEWDSNDIGLKDLTGLNLTGLIVSPHYTKEEEMIVSRFEKITGKGVCRLSDCQALLITNDKIKLIKE